jgi:hypothetical protein
MADGDPATAPDDPFKDIRDAKPWLALLKEAERAEATYQDKCDNIDKLYADLDTLAKDKTDREFQIFWANLEVVKPSIYARPPVPVVVPRFKDQKELPRKASEVLERCLSSSFEADDIDATMRLIRDDLATNARGVVWLRYEKQGEEGYATERVCKEHLDRRDFRHEPARKWAETGWVARRAWLNREQGLKRFGDAWLKVKLTEKRSEKDDEYKGEKKGEAWELWHKGHNCVVWVTDGIDEVLDIQPPPLNLEGFWPCPRPAYGTVKRGTLTPIPDFLYYKDQVEEINELTARISALSESLRLKGFYPAGASDVAEAVEAVLKDMDNRATLVPVNNLQLFGDRSLKDSIVWLPIEIVATTISELVQLRKQLIEDVYQITGISDIMRGSTEASETLGAQKLKSQYGSVRVRDRQNELVRLARDITRIEAEIIAENFSPETMATMSQSDLPRQADIEQQMTGMIQQAQQLVADPLAVQQARANPDQAKQMIEAAKAKMQMLEATVTLEKVVELLRSQKLRPFVLEIETDSTIQPDEDAAKQRATEFVTAVGGFMQQAVTAVEQVPQMAPLAAEMLKYVASQFRAGRQLEGAIDKFADDIAKTASQPKGPTPEQMKAQADAQKSQQDAMKAQSDAKQAQADSQIALMELNFEREKAASEARLEELTLANDKWKAELSAATSILVARIGAQTDIDSQSFEGQLAIALGLHQQGHDIRMAKLNADLAPPPAQVA